MDTLYSDDILDRYKYPHCKGEQRPHDPDAIVHQLRARNPSCGDSYTMTVVTTDETISHASWDGEGCAISAVAMDLVCEWLVGKSMQELKAITPELIQRLSGIPMISPGREKCLYLPSTLS